MAIEQIEYIIHKDGRVEEKVTGVKGAEVKCVLTYFDFHCTVLSRPISLFLAASDTVPRGYQGSRESPR